MKQQMKSINVMSDMDRTVSDVRKLVKSGKRFASTEPKYFIRTYGCQMNERDSETFAYMLHAMGFQEAKDIRSADFVLFNTCVIRENAENRFFGNLGSLKSLKEKNKSVLIAAAGCMMQRDHIVKKIRGSYPYVDLVFGTHNIHELPNLLKAHLEQESQIIEVWEDNSDIIEGMQAIRSIPHKAFVNITYGCNNFCTFCVVPYTRGREKSRRPGHIVEEVRGLIQSGVKEVCLLGQNVNSYGRHFDMDYSFSDLLREICKIDGKFRLRFMTPHPKDFPDELIEVIAEHEKIPNYIHLPVQAGSSRLLKKMNRTYTREAYLALVEKIRARIPDVSLSTDIIIGFPSETEEDVDQLIDLIHQVEYDSAFTFIYSPREGTPAAKFDEQIPEELKHERFERMLKVQQDVVIRKNKAFDGRTVEVLFDTHEDGVVSGKTECMRNVSVLGVPELLGQFKNVKITEAKKFSLFGELAD